MVREFVAFKDKYGLTSVSKAMLSKHPEFAKLAHWINKTRGKFSIQQRGGRPHGMTKHKAAVLDAVGFERLVLRRESWERNYKSLLKYMEREKRGCNVPTKCPEFGNLGHWVRYVPRGMGALSVAFGRSQLFRKIWRYPASRASRPPATSATTTRSSSRGRSRL